MNDATMRRESVLRFARIEQDRQGVAPHNVGVLRSAGLSQAQQGLPHLGECAVVRRG